MHMTNTIWICFVPQIPQAILFFRFLGKRKIRKLQRMIFFQNGRLVPYPQERRAIKFFCHAFGSFCNTFCGLRSSFVGILLNFDQMHPASDSVQKKRVKKHNANYFFCHAFGSFCNAFCGLLSSFVGLLWNFEHMHTASDSVKNQTRPKKTKYSFVMLSVAFGTLFVDLSLVLLTSYWISNICTQLQTLFKKNVSKKIMQTSFCVMLSVAFATLFVDFALVFFDVLWNFEHMHYFPFGDGPFSGAMWASGRVNLHSVLGGHISHTSWWNSTTNSWIRCQKTHHICFPALQFQLLSVDCCNKIKACRVVPPKSLAGNVGW